MLTKKCIHCSKEKELSEFGFCRNTPDLHKYVCKSCSRIYRAKYHLEHREEQNKKSRSYYHTPQGNLLCRARVSRRRARLKMADGTYTIQDIMNQGEKQNWICFWQGPGCAIKCQNEYHIDHVIPLSRGGTNWPENIVISCPHCNKQKHDKTPEEYKDYISKLDL